MKRQLFSLFFAIGISIPMLAIPAKPGKAKVTQPDGSTLTIVLHGDEFRHVTTTSDNYTVLQTHTGYQYAVKKDGVLVASGITAHDTTERSAEEIEFLSAKQKMLQADMTEEQKQQSARARSLWKTQATNLGQQKVRYDYNNFRGLVILVEWNDCSFTRSDAKEVFSSMINDEGYSGYYTQGANPQWEACTGSVYDYFSDNSMGLFKPKFDVVGPIKINRSKTYPQGTNRAWQCAVDVITAVDNIVDFSQYDADKDGVVDMFYIIFAGYGSNVSGNDSRYLWPHASQFAYPYRKYDGVTMGRFACSTELCGNESTGDNMLDGIGTMCHEFSHVLGLPDLYDTDYEENGQSVDPGVWTIMAGGGYNNNSRTPTGYCSYERYASGFMVPELITGNNTYSLGALGETNRVLRINSAVEKEFFLLENRQKTKWDEYLPGEGLLVFRVDSTNVSVWQNNTLNANPEHNYFELLRGLPQTYGDYVMDSEYDPLPGKGNVTMLNNNTTPNLRSWTGAETPLTLYNISEADGVISFNIGSDEGLHFVEDFETMALTSEDATDVKGVFCNWNMEGARIIVSTEAQGNGKQSAGLVRNAKLTSSVFSKATYTLEYDVWNTSRTRAVFVTSYSTDNGVTWTRLSNANGQSQTTVSANKDTHVKFMANIPAGAMLKIEQTSGSPVDYCYIDDLTVMFVPGSTSDIAGVTTQTPRHNGNIYSIDGRYMGRDFNALGKGIYIVNGKKVVK